MNNTITNAQILLSIEHILNAMDNKNHWTPMEETLNWQLKQAWHTLADDPEVQAVFKTPPALLV